MLADAQEAIEAEQYWSQTVAARWPTLRLAFVGYPAADGLDGLDFLIVSGWLGEERMFWLFNSHVARETVLIAYPFERVWQSSARRQWQQHRRPPAAGKPRSQLLNVASPVPDEPVAPTPAPGTETGAEPIEFELDLERSLRKKRRKLALPVPGVATTTECRLVWFTDGSHAYLARDRKVLVVSDLHRGADQSQTLPERELSELRVGDSIAFLEGADSDVVRRQADAGLEKAGKLELRQVSGRWREALRGSLERTGGKLDTVVGTLAAQGCIRTPTTVRNWIRTDDTIGPLEDADLDAIATATGDAQLRETLEDVRSAIRQVRGAHLQASAYLHGELLRELPRLLSGDRRAAKCIDIEGLGRLLVVEVSEIEPEPVQVALAESNRRRQELPE